MFTCTHIRTSHTHSYITCTPIHHTHITCTPIHHTHITRTSHAHSYITRTSHAHSYIICTLVHHMHTRTSHTHSHITCIHSFRGIPLLRDVSINTAVLLVTVAHRSEREKQYNNITKELVLSNTQTLCIITLT